MKQLSFNHMTSGSNKTFLYLQKKINDFQICSSLNFTLIKEFSTFFYGFIEMKLRQNRKQDCVLSETRLHREKTILYSETIKME